jgi:predicted amidophosphoribosyltransferase
LKNRLLCIKCNYDINPFEIKWICKVCGADFNSDAKEYNPLEFRVMKLAVKKAIFNGIEAKPPLIPCCITSESQLKSLKFMHKKECNGILYEGILDNQKIVVCLKCKMINFYNNHLWMCPLCKNKYNIFNKYENSINLKNKNNNNNISFYKDENFQKKYKKYLKTNNNDYFEQKLLKKKYCNYVKFADEIQPKSYKRKDKSNFEIQNLSLKKNKSANIQNLPVSRSFCNKTDENNNISKYEYQKNAYFNHNKNIFIKSNRDYFISNYNNKEIKPKKKVFTLSKRKLNMNN